MSSDEAEGSSRRSVAVNTFPSEITYRPDWTLRDNRFHRIETQARQPSREWAESSSGWTSVPDTPIFDSNVSLDLNSTLSPPLEYYPRPQSSQYFTQTAADSELQQTPTTTDTASWDDDLSAFHNHSFPSSRPAGDLPFVPASAADQWQQMHRVHPTLPKRTFLPAPQVDPNDPDVSRDNVYNLPTDFWSPQDPSVINSGASSNSISPRVSDTFGQDSNPGSSSIPYAPANSNGWATRTIDWATRSLVHSTSNVFDWNMAQCAPATNDPGRRFQSTSSEPSVSVQSSLDFQSLPTSGVASEQSSVSAAPYQVLTNSSNAASSSSSQKGKHGASDRQESHDESLVLQQARKERKRLHNRLAQKAFRARSIAAKGQEAKQKADSDTHARLQSERLVASESLVAQLQKENRSLQQQLSDVGTLPQQSPENADPSMGTRPFSSNSRIYNERKYDNAS